MLCGMPESFPVACPKCEAPAGFRAAADMTSALDSSGGAVIDKLTQLEQ
jgi:hypothetical protein